MKLTLTPQRWDMVAPFVTAGETVNYIDVLHVTLEHEGLAGRAASRASRTVILPRTSG